ncbi:MAG: hypothetical protein ACHQIK_21460 [Candidatus Acidiferrales bacterium]
MPAYYADTVGRFQEAPLETLEHTLMRAYESDRYKDLITAQISSWRNQIKALKAAFSGADLAPFNTNNWGIAIEFVVPRKMGRIDTVLLIGNAIVVLEFKSDSVDSGAADQVEDYCLDLLYFHAPSHQHLIYPVVVANTGTDSRTRRAQAFGELQPTKFVDANRLGNWLSSVAAMHFSESQLPHQTMGRRGLSACSDHS